jgi:hypothetical protein
VYAVTVLIAMRSKIFIAAHLSSDSLQPLA